MKKISAYIIIALVSSIATAQSNTPAPQTLKASADSLYMAGEYNAAITIYEELSTEKEAFDVYYNLANAYYKTDNIAKAVLNYERALLLAPADEDIKFNLALAKNKTVDKVSEPYEIFFMAWLKSIINLMSIDVWAVTAIISFLVFLLAALLFLFNKSTAIRKSTFFIALFALLTTLFANLSALHHHDKLNNRTAAIIMQPSVTAKSTPDASGTDLFVIHEGRKVNIVDDTMKGWKEIILEDGTKGWVPTNSLEKI